MSERVALLTGGGDKPYALGMAMALSSAGTSLDLIGSDDLEVVARIHCLDAVRRVH